MNSMGGSRRQRLVSASYEGVGARWKEQLRDVSLAVYEECPQMEEIAKKVAKLNRVPSGSSFFVMDASRVEGSMDEWRREMRGCAPFYPLGCNDDPLLLELLTRNEQCNLQVSTLPELERALSLVAPSRILFHSHLLTRKMMRCIMGLEEPLFALMVDSEEGAMEAAEMNPFQPLMMRVSLSPDSDRVDLAMGMPIEEAVECVPRLIKCGVPLAGLSIQLMAEGEDMVERGRAAVMLLKSLSSLPLSILDVGDGVERAELDQAAELLDCILEAAGSNHLKLMATPGRFFAASAFTLITSIVGKRWIDARAITRRDEDGGREGVVYETSESVYGVMGGGLMGERLRCHPLPLGEEEEGEGEMMESAVMGAALDGIDFPQRHARLPSLDVGDCLMWKEMGAYAAREEDSVPVYYYTGRAHWERLSSVGREEEEKEEGDGLMSDGGSEVDMDSDDDDMTLCFGGMFS